MDEGIDRFLAAQAGVAGQALALSELRAGQKTSHWIWYVFPQLRGLGRSSLAEAYGLDGLAEAEAYLRHPALRARLLEVTEVVARQVARGADLRRLMGSGVDAQKLVSSLTLFEGLARRLAPEGLPGLDRLAPEAATVLAAAAAQGLPPCAFTGQALAAAGPSPGAPRGPG